MVPQAPPGPRGHFLLGNTPEFHRDLLGFFERCARGYGDICGFTTFHLRCCFVNHPDLIERVLVLENARMVKAWDVRELRIVLGEGLLTGEGEAWRRQRQLIQPAFHGERIRQYAAIMAARAREAVGGWNDGVELSVHAEMMRLTLTIVAQALFGADISSQDVGAVGRALELFMRRFEAMLTGFVPLPLWVPTPSGLRARRAVRRLDRIVSDLVGLRRASGERGGDLLSSLLDAADGAGGPMSERQLRDEIVTLLLAGHETTALALSWTLYLLGSHPEVEARLVGELEEVLDGRAPSAEDVARLSFTKQVIQESMRLYPPVWGMGREAVEDFELGGYRIGRGTQIYLIQYVTHRDPRFFPGPERFLPDRWSPDAAKRIPKYAYFPFGGGPRHCIGSGFALMEATLLLAALLQRCRFDLVPGHPVEVQPAITLRPRYGIRAVVRRR